MSTKLNIRITVLLIWGILIGAGIGVGRCYDLVVNGWEALIGILAVMIGGTTFERVQSLRTTAKVAEASADVAVAEAAGPLND